MSSSLRIFSTEEEYQTFYNNIPYSTPFISLIKSNGETHIDYKIPPPPFHLTALENGTITINIPSGVNSTYATSLSYSKDKSNWTETLVDSTNQTITIPVEIGDKVYLKGMARQWGSNTSSNMKINSTNNIMVSGNIMSLLYGDDFVDKTLFPSGSQYSLLGLFSGNTHLVDAINLILPATTLTKYCYTNMFYGCTSLTSAPELSATTLADICYNGMFNGCASLTAATELPATTLTNYCYSSMFFDCTSLTAAPELPATTLANGCYNQMFLGCRKLNSITMLATNISATNCLNNWASGVASTGTFTKAATMTTLPSGGSGIPNGWTVVDYQASS